MFMDLLKDLEAGLQFGNIQSNINCSPSTEMPKNVVRQLQMMSSRLKKKLCGCSLMCPVRQFHRCFFYNVGLLGKAFCPENLFLTMVGHRLQG